MRLIALLAGGGVALSSHGTKAATRLAANTSPEPFSNIALSLGEDVIAVGASLLMAFHPVVILLIVGIFLVFAVGASCVPCAAYSARAWLVKVTAIGWLAAGASVAEVASV